MLLKVRTDDQPQPPRMAYYDPDILKQNRLWCEAGAPCISLTGYNIATVNYGLFIYWPESRWDETQHFTGSCSLIAGSGVLRGMWERFCIDPGPMGLF